MKVLNLVVLVLWGQCAFAQDNSAQVSSPFRALSAGVGAGYVSQTGQPGVWGETFGVGGAIRVGGDDERPVFLEFGLSTLRGQSRSQTAQSLITETPYVFATRVSPIGDLSLNTFTDGTGAYATSIVNLTDGSGDDGSISSTTFSPPGGQTSVFAFTPTDAGGLFTSVVTDGSGAIAGALGAIFDESGAVVIANGNSPGTEVISARRDRVEFTDGSVRLSTVVPLANGLTLVPRGGLVLQSFGRLTDLTQTISVADGFAADPATPALSISQRTDLRTNLTGLSVGLGLSWPLSDGWRVSLGADIGAAQGRSRYSSSEAVALGLQQVQNIAGPHGHDTNIARMGRISVGVSRQLAPGAVLSMTLYSQATTGIPYLARRNIASVSPVVSADGNDASLAVSGATNQDFEIRYGDLRNWGVSISLVWRF